MIDKVLVSDFDGTMTQHDFFKFAIDFLIPKNTPNYWQQYRLGEITHFEALRRYFASIECSEQEVLDYVFKMGLDPDLRQSVAALNERGWKVIIASAGCDWYIRKLLDRADVNVEIHANPGRFEEGKGLIMELPVSSTYFSPTVGIDKPKIVSDMRERYETVAFAGDGFPDVDPSLVVSEDLRFGRADLADVLSERKLKFHPFNRWSDVANALLQLT